MFLQDKVTIYYFDYEKELFMNKRIISNILLLVTALIWGSSFVAQKAGTVLEPFTYNGIRTLVGGISLVPVILILSKAGKGKTDEAVPKEIPDHWRNCLRNFFGYCLKSSAVRHVL